MPVSTILRSPAFSVCLLALLSVPVLALSDSYETAPEQDPTAVLGSQAAGPDYRVLAPVRSDGFLRMFQLETSYGTETILGDGLLKLRLHDLMVLRALDALENDQTFVDGLKQAAMKPVEFVESTVSDPVGTAKNTVTGVGRLFNRLGRGVESAVSGEGSPADLARAITGQDRARRELAVQLGVDPYTKFAPLSDKLDQAAGVSAAGGWTVKAVMALIPGGMISNIASTADDLRNSIVDSTLPELEERTSATLLQIDATQEIVEKLTNNTNFTATERAIIAYRLDYMAGVEGRDILVSRAAEASSREEAYFQLRRAVLLENYHQKTSPIGQIRLVGGFPVAILKNGAAALVLPLDMVAWTQTSANAFTGINTGLGQLPFPPTSMSFIVTGDLTDLTAERLASFGWDLTSNWPMPEGPVK
ncbi:hypothetical protein JM93_03359 [Roseibium hamelinense]|uniref:Uncharacterized protein n=1 Tax=Roseibium hamelinense TaxID=150831 RepID=A0A562SPE8_9HYPH|nr:hypothetical protein [Roseibium hamelinense]MTI44379.1 hypothetical protein [Roseibium hamelinense]TWI82844.1 hypothetical protein JM93_03359 [Roseibium hamelinense]